MPEDDIATIADLNAAYRIILGRDGDVHGLTYYAERIEQGLTLDALRREFMASPEFRSKKAHCAKRVEVSPGLFVSVDSSEPEFGGVIAKHGTWEPHIIDTIVFALSPGDTYVDIGANIGLMAFHAARRVGSRGKVIAFEPNRDNAERFVEGVAANGFQT